MTYRLMQSMGLAPLYQPEGAAGTAGDTGEAGAGDTGGAGGEAGAGKGGEAAGSKTGAAGDFAYPDGFPDQFRAETPADSMARLFADRQNLRAELGRRGAVPKEATGYAFEFSDRAKPYLGSEDNDQVFDAIKGVFHKHGITDKQQSIVSDLIESFADGGLIPEPMNMDQMIADLAPADFKGTDQERKAAGEARLNEATTWANNYATSAGLDEQAAAELASLTSTPGGMKLLDHLRQASITRTVNPGGEAAGGEVTAQMLEARLADPRNQHGGDKYSEGFARETQKLYQQLYGD